MRAHNLEWFAGVGDAHSDRFTLTFELNHLCFLFLEEDLVFRIAHVCSAELTPLESDQSIAMQHSTNVGRLGFGRRAYHPTQLAVRIFSSTNKLEVSGEDE